MISDIEFERIRVDKNKQFVEEYMKENGCDWCTMSFHNMILIRGNTFQCAAAMVDYTASRKEIKEFLEKHCHVYCLFCLAYP